MISVNAHNVKPINHLDHEVEVLLAEQSVVKQPQVLKHFASLLSKDQHDSVFQV